MCVSAGRVCFRRSWCVSAGRVCFRRSCVSAGRVCFCRSCVLLRSVCWCQMHHFHQKTDEKPEDAEDPELQTEGKHLTDLILHSSWPKLLVH